MNLAANLKAHMGQRKISLIELSRLSKVPKQTLHNWLSGAEPKNLNQIRAVAQVFNLSIEQLCYGDKTVSKKTEIREYEDEINAGIFEVVLRRVRK